MTKLLSSTIASAAAAPPASQRAAGAPPRRHWLRRAGRSALAAAMMNALIGALIGTLVASLAGCGFALRAPPELPYSKIALAGFARHSPMAEALRDALPARTQVVEAASQAEVVLTAVEDVLNRTAVASGTAGQVREFRLRAVLKFRLNQPDGKPLLAETELEQSRDFSYNESAALAKQTEEAALLRELRADLARQVLRVLAAAPRASLDAAAPPSSSTSSASSSSSPGAAASSPAQN